MDTGENIASLVSEPFYHLAAGSFFFFFPYRFFCLAVSQRSHSQELSLLSTVQCLQWPGTHQHFPIFYLENLAVFMHTGTSHKLLPEGALWRSGLITLWVACAPLLSANTWRAQKYWHFLFSSEGTGTMLSEPAKSMKLEIGFVPCPSAKRWTTNRSSVQSNSSHDEWLVIGLMHFILVLQPISPAALTSATRA